MMSTTSKMCILVGLLGATACDRAMATKDVDAVATAEPKLATPSPPLETTTTKAMKATSIHEALDITKPRMGDTVDKWDEGSVAFARWAIGGSYWSDFVTSKNGTTFAAVMKDSEEERGKLMCLSGAIIQIEVAKTESGKLYEGLMHDGALNIYRFAAVGSTGDLVEKSRARFCGVVTGKYDYSNSRGGTGHAVKLVGMFDLPANGSATP